MIHYGAGIITILKRNKIYMVNCKHLIDTALLSIISCEECIQLKCSHYFVTGMLHGGHGVTGLNNWLASLNIPVPADTTWKRREREIGPSVEQIAQESCRLALEEETRLTALTIGMPELQYMEMTAGYDMGWQRRGTGRSANSLSGHGSLIGYHSGKILAFGSRKMSCRYCEVADKQGKTTEPHDCRRNWSGSSKAMEPSLGVELLKKTQSQNAKVKTLIMDEDSTTIAHVRRDYDADMVKWSDINHAKKCLSNAIYRIQPKYKKQLTPKVIKYFKKNYAYVLAQNKGKVDELRSGIISILPHVFGDHSSCGEWCGYMKNSDSYKHKSLPKGQDLQGDELRADLEKIFELHACNAEKLAPAGSTMANESWNNTVASKAPKARHYSSSESLDFRISAAAAQKNMSPEYLNDAFQRKTLSPSMSLKKHASKLIEKSRKRKAQAQTKTFKRRRLELGETRTSRLKSLELREGESYRSGVDMEHTSDITQIPSIIKQAKPTPLQANPVHTFVFFDLETTDMEADASICQIAAVAPNSTFNVYTLPEKQISRGASSVTHLQLHDSVLTHKGNIVSSTSIEKGIEGFTSFLNTYTSVVLCGHNVKNFDTVHLLRHINTSGLRSSFDQAVVGFSDTLPMFRQMFPERSTHSQENLVRDLLGESYDAHNALGDCKALKDLVMKTSSEKDMLQYSFEVQWAWNNVQHSMLIRQNKLSFGPIISKKIISQYFASKSAASGLSLQHLQLAFHRNGELGLRALLTEKGPDNKARVSANPTKVIEKLAKYFT